MLVSAPVDMGTFAYDDTTAGSAIQLPHSGPGPVTVYSKTAGSYDDTCAIEISPDLVNWREQSSGIGADKKVTIWDACNYVRINPVGAGTQGTVQFILCAVRRD